MLWMLLLLRLLGFLCVVIVVLGMCLIRLVLKSGGVFCSLNMFVLGWGLGSC